jgi:hypothetical protein
MSNLRLLLALFHVCCAFLSTVTGQCGEGECYEGGQCFFCSPGYYAPDTTDCIDGLSCYPCDAGTYSLAYAASCTPCEPGTYSSSISSNTCTDCAAGSYAEYELSTECTDCPAGKASSVVASTNSSTCTACIAGTASTSGASTCEICGKGTFSLEESDACYPCPVATYGNMTGMGSCYPCPAGYASPETGATAESACQVCSAGFYSSEKSESCTPCAVGSYSENEGSASCTLCPAGKASDVDAAASSYICANCSSGSYSGVGSGICQSCETGTFSTAGSSSCSTSCPAGQGVLSGETSISSSTEVCASCNAGYFNDGSSIYCSSCPANTVSGLDASNCRSSCSAGQGVYKGSSSTSTSVNECGDCEPGYWNNGTYLSCESCATGTIASAMAASSCTTCNGSEYSFANMFVAATECVALCPAGTGVYDHAYSTISDSEVACGSCQPGYYQEGDSTMCTKCTKQQYATSAGSTGYGTCYYPYESFWYDWKTSSGDYYPCHAVSSGLSVETGVILVCLLGLLTLAFFTQIKQDDGRWDRKSAIVLLVYTFFPILDYLTDLLYILTSQYYNAGTFVASFMAIVFPALVFARRLWLRGIRAKFWLWEIPSTVWFSEYDNFYKILVTAVMIFPYVIVNSVILIPMTLLGTFMAGTKVIAIGRVSNVWYYWLTGKNDYATKEIVDTQVLNEAIYTHIVCETFFQIIAQVVNNTFMNRWTLVAYVSIGFAVLNTFNGLYQIAYFKLHRKINLVDLPFSFTVGGLLPADYQIRSTSRSKSLSDFEVKNPIRLTNPTAAIPLSGVVPADPEQMRLLENELKFLKDEMKESREDVRQLKLQCRSMEQIIRELSRVSARSRPLFGVDSVSDEL